MGTLLPFVAAESIINGATFLLLGVLSARSQSDVVRARNVDVDGCEHGLVGRAGRRVRCVRQTVDVSDDAPRQWDTCGAVDLDGVPLAAQSRDGVGSVC